MQKSGCLLCKSEYPLYKNIPSEKNLLLKLYAFIPAWSMFFFLFAWALTSYLVEIAS